MKDFFVSYNKQDRPWAEWVAWQLREAGYKLELQAWHFMPGQNFILRMQEAATQCRRTIAILSDDYLKAEFTQPEWAAAFVQDPTSKDSKLLPIRVRSCKPEGLLRAIVYADLVGLTEADARKILLETIERITKGEDGTPAAAPAFPGAAATSPAGPRPRFPACHLPHARNPNFTGREELLSRLREALDGGVALAITQAIHGMGGVGKTQLANEYAHRHRGDYALVWWLRAEQTATLAGDYAGLAPHLGIAAPANAPVPEVCRAVKAALEQSDGWLLIFDNAEGPETLKDYLPQDVRGHVLVTSRNPNFRAVAKPLAVEVWPKREAVEFLLKRTERKGKEAREAAARLAEELGYLPLALEQAGAYMDETALGFNDYITRFRAHRRELLALGKPYSDSDRTVATTWDISFQRLRETHPAAADLFNLCAFFAPDDIPLDIIEEGVEFLPPALAEALKDQLKLDQAIATLRKHALADVEDGKLSLHRVVQLVARDRLASDETATWAELAVCVLNKVFPMESWDVRTWPQCQRVLAHARTAAEHAERLALAPDATGRLLNQIGVHLLARAQFADAHACIERALKIVGQVYGPEHPTVAYVINNLGSVLKELGDLSGARACFERALRIGGKESGPDDPALVTVLNNLGQVLHALGDLSEARTYLERALRIGEKENGPEHLAVATTVNNLGLVLQELGALTEARACFERALRVSEKEYGPEHPTVAMHVNNLGRVLHALGDLPRAKAYIERALKSIERAYGTGQPRVATCINNLGTVLQGMGDLAGAKGCYERTLKIDEKAYGPEHPEVATDVVNLGFLLEQQGDPLGAKRCYERAMAIFRKFLPKEHPYTQFVRRGLERLGG